MILFFLVLYFVPAYSQVITVNEPRGGSIYKAGGQMTVAWTTSGISGNIRINLVRSGGSVVTLADDISPVSSPLAVTLQEGIPADTYTVRIYQISNSGITGSTPDFYINSNHSGINIARPGSTSRLTWGIEEEIKWVRIGLAPELNVSLTLLKGNTLKGSIARLLPGTRYNWTVPNLPAGDDYRIKVALDPGGIQGFGGNPNVYYKISSPFRIASTLPDLAVYSMKITPPPVNQTEVTFKAAIENLSPYLQANHSKAVLKIKQGSWSSSRVFLVPAINKKSFAEIKTSYVLPRSGNYSHELLLNFKNEFNEATRENNKKVISKKIVYLPDLLVSAYVSDRTPRIFKKTYFHIDVKNIGKHDSIPVKMTFRIKDKKTAVYQIPALKPNQKKYFKRSVKYNTKGTRGYRVTVDPENTMEEMKKGNNEVNGSINVLLPTDFDKGGVAHCDLKPEISTDGNVALEGYYYPVTVKVKQLGNKKCDNTTIYYKDHGNNVEKRYMLPEILPGEVYHMVYRFKWNRTGNKMFEVVVDPDNKLLHEPKQNNKASKTINVQD